MGKEAAVRASTECRFDEQGVTGFHCPITAPPNQSEMCLCFSGRFEEGSLDLYKLERGAGEPRLRQGKPGSPSPRDPRAVEKIHGEGGVCTGST